MSSQIEAPQNRMPATTMMSGTDTTACPLRSAMKVMSMPARMILRDSSQKPENTSPTLVFLLVR